MTGPKKLVICSVFAGIFAALCTRPAYADDKTGFQYWSTVDVAVDINKDWKTVFEEEFRLGDGGGHLYYHHSDIALIYKGLAKDIDLGFNFRKVYVEDDTNIWRQENRPHLNVTFRKKFEDIDFSTRSRLEFRDNELTEDLWRYRNLFAFKLPFEWTSLKLRPYIADEIFINLNDEGYIANRVYAGVAFNLLKNVKTAVYYVWQSARTSPGRDDIHAVGTKLIFNF
jgi:hypothetical protein